MKSGNRPTLSARAVARRCGVSHIAVLKAVRERRLPPLDQIADLDEAERLWRDQACPVKAMVAERERVPEPPPSPGGALAKAKLRRERALADIAEMEAARMSGELVDASEIRTALASMDTAIRDFLLQIPHASAARVLEAGLKRGEAGVAEVLTRDIRAALSALAGAEVVPAPKR